jgi:lysozyme
MKHNRGDFDEAADEFMKWSKAGGKVLKGLVNRRLDEQRLYLRG